MRHNDHCDICHIMTTVTCVRMSTVTCHIYISHNDHSYKYHIKTTVICVIMTTVTHRYRRHSASCHISKPLSVCPPSTPSYAPGALPQTVLSCHEYVQLRGGGGGGGRALCKHLWKVGRGDGVIWGHMGTGTSWCQHNSMARLAELPT